MNNSSSTGDAYCSRKLVSWETDITLLAGQELSVELKEQLPNKAHEFVCLYFVHLNIMSMILKVSNS